MKGPVRVEALLYGMAVGDAFGKMAEGYWPSDIRRVYGGRLEEFLDPIQPHSVYTWAKAEVTDDTRMALITVRSMLEKGRVDASDITARVLKEPVKGWPGWEEFRDCARAGHFRSSIGSGAPGRAILIGTVYPSHQLDEIVAAVNAVVRPTHDSRSAVAGSAAAAAACSALLDGKTLEEGTALAIEAAATAERLTTVPDDLAPSVARRLAWVRANVRRGTRLEVLRQKGLNPGFTTWEVVSTAFAVVLAEQDARSCIIAAANLGGDADSVAALAGALSACYGPGSLPDRWVEAVVEANSLHDVPELAAGLYQLRVRNARKEADGY